MNTPSPKAQQTDKEEPKSVTRQAFEQAEKDIEQDPDMDMEDADNDLDEGELAQKDNSND
jgi:hypothetical protein